MSDCPRERFMAALQAVLDAAIKTTYGPDATVLRNIDAPETSESESTPRAWLVEMPRRRTETTEAVVPIYDLQVKLYGVVRRKDTSQALMQTEGNNLEYWMDRTLLNITVLAGGNAVVFQEPGQTSGVYAGDNEAWLEYDFTLRYAQEV
jgi:hypothetical protein